ncbi:MAG: serine/threonine protein phosphatase, partial [Paracoccaceae bacterium]
LRPDMSWLHPRIGGAVTLQSYGVRSAADRRVATVQIEAVAAVPAEHRAFLAGLPTSFRRDKSIFVHAGIRPGVPLELQDETDLVWIRQPFLEDNRDHGALIVHGHTALDAAALYSNRLNLDSGAAYGGPLSSVAIEGLDVYFLTPSGRVRMRAVN